MNKNGLIFGLMVVLTLGLLASVAVAQEPNPEAPGLQFQQPADEAYVLPSRFMPVRMQKMLLFPDDIYFVAPGNFKVLAEGEPEIIVKGQMRNLKRYRIQEALAVQNFTIVPPKEAQIKGEWTEDSALRLNILIRYMPKRDRERLMAEFNGNKSLPPSRALSYFKNIDPTNLQKSRIDNFIETLPRGDALDLDDQVLWKYERIHNRWDSQDDGIPPQLKEAVNWMTDPRLQWYVPGPAKHPSVEARTGLPNSTLPVNDYYCTYTGWKRHPRTYRNSIWTLPELVTIEGKLMFIKRDGDDFYLVNIEFAGKNPINPLEVVHNVARRMINAAWDADLRIKLYDYDFYDGYTPYGP